MQFLEQYELLFPATVLKCLEDNLRKEGVFTFFDASLDPYDALLYRRQEAHYSATTVCLFDQNVLNDVLDPIKDVLERGCRPCTERGRFGATLMAFLQCADILIEPSIAVHEKGPHALRDLQLFRCADNVPAVEYAKLALGQTECLPPSALPKLQEQEKNLDFAKKIKGRSVFRAALLKIACLELTNLSSKKKMLEFLRWSFEDFCIARIPLLLACHYFCPNRESPMIEKLRSADRGRAIQGIENALWDVQLLQDWTDRVARQKKENRLYLLCSRDRPLQKIARVLCHAGASAEDLVTILTDHFVSFWGERDGNELSRVYFEYESRAKDPSRLVNLDPSMTYLTKMSSDLEDIVLKWNA